MGPEIAKRAETGNALVEPPAHRLLRLQVRRHQGGATELQHLAELAALDELARIAQRRNETRGEGALVDNAGGGDRLPQRERLIASAAQRLLAKDMLAVGGGGDGGLRVQIVRRRIDEQVDARIGDQGLPIRLLLGPTETRLAFPTSPRIDIGDHHQIGLERGLVLHVGEVA